MKLTLARYNILHIPDNFGEVWELKEQRFRFFINKIAK